MIIFFPRYENGQAHWSKEMYERSVDENDYFQTIDDFKKYIDKMYIHVIVKHESIVNQINHAIENNDVVKFLLDDLNEFKKWNMTLIKTYPMGDVRDYWKTQSDILTATYKVLILKNNLFIKNNKDAVLNVLNEKKEETLTTCKLKRKEANKKYYEKYKKIITKEPRHNLTDGEKKEHRKEANRLYYTKQKLKQEQEHPKNII